MILKIYKMGFGYRLFDNISEIQVTQITQVNLKEETEGEGDRNFMRETKEPNECHNGYRLSVFFRYSKLQRAEVWYIDDKTCICNDEGKVIETLYCYH